MSLPRAFDEIADALALAAVRRAGEQHALDSQRRPVALEHLLQERRAGLVRPDVDIDPCGHRSSAERPARIDPAERECLMRRQPRSFKGLVALSLACGRPPFVVVRDVDGVRRWRLASDPFPRQLPRRALSA